jgi:hypothetical protein
MGPAGFVDIDQLGMCFPAPPHDPELFLLKERNVSAVAANFRRVGCDASPRRQPEMAGLGQEARRPAQALRRWRRRR